jgi:hypothetical protein
MIIIRLPCSATLYKGRYTADNALQALSRKVTAQSSNLGLSLRWIEFFI